VIPKPETEAERTRRIAQWQAWLRSLDDGARQAWESGRVFYVVKMSLGGSNASWMAMNATDGDDIAGALQTIEAIGWRLDSTGYVYQPLRERSHALTDTQQMTGNIIGIFTFRRPSVPPVPS
jgi:hypothetical protein